MKSLLEPAIESLLRERGFHKLTEPQIKAIPHILRGEHTLIMAPTGSGKTEAALLPILQKMMREHVGGIKLVYITPLRALNRDLIDRISWWAGRLGFRATVRHGDTPPKERRSQALLSPDILITTPETFSLLLNTKVMRRHLESIKYLIVDELHELIESKRGVQLSINMERLAYEAGEYQRIGLSATIGSPEKALEYLVGVGRSGVIVSTDITKMMKIDIHYPKPEPLDYQLSGSLYTYPSVVARVRTIRDIIARHKATLVFTNTRPMAEILGSRLYLYDDELPIMVHHGSLSRDIRVKIENMLKTGKIRGIICTSSLELGIDVGHIDMVIQYNSPRQASRLVQRVGRSGHWIEKVSKGAVVVQDLDDYLESLIIRNRVMRGELEEIKILEKPIDVLAHEIAGILTRQNSIHIDDLYSIVKRSIYYRGMSKEELENVLRFLTSLTDRYIYYDADTGLIKRPINRRRLFEYYYSVLSMIPEVKQYLVIDDETTTPIGVLDEEFIAVYGEPNTKFIISGRPWRIIQIYKNKVFVKPEEDFIGAIPHWVGEEIPVPYEVAQEVGALKREIEEAYHAKGDQGIDEYTKEAGLERDALKILIETVKQGYRLPTDKTITIERYQDKIIVNIHGGTLINRSIASILATVLFDMYGETVEVSSEPYRIIFRAVGLRPKDIKEILMAKWDYHTYFRKAVTSSNIFLWRLIHVARRMGIVSRERSLSRREAEMLKNALEGTPVYEEAYRETSIKDYDRDATLNYLAKIKGGEIDIVVYDEATPLTRDYLERYEVKFEAIEVDRGRKLRILSKKVKLLNEVRTFICLDCLENIWEARIKDLPEKPVCTRCGGNKIGLTIKNIDEILPLIYRYKRDPKQLKRSKVWRDILKSGEIIAKNGRLGAILLASENLSYKDIEELLTRYREPSDKLYEEIIRRENINLLRKFRS